MGKSIKECLYSSAACPWLDSVSYCCEYLLPYVTFLAVAQWWGPAESVEVQVSYGLLTGGQGR